MEVVGIDQLVTRILGRTPRAAMTRVVAIDGPSGSGKTTLARRIRRRLRCPSVHMDALYPGWDGLAEAPGLLVEQVLGPLAAGEDAGYRRWDWDADRWAERHPVPASEVLLVEGVGSGALACAPFLSMLVWIEAPRDERMRRGIERDGEAYRPHWERWARQEAALFTADRTRERADLRLDSNSTIAHDPETEVVTVG